MIALLLILSSSGPLDIHTDVPDCPNLSRAIAGSTGATGQLKVRDARHGLYVELRSAGAIVGQRLVRRPSTCAGRADAAVALADAWTLELFLLPVRQKVRARVAVTPKIRAKRSPKVRRRKHEPTKPVLLVSPVSTATVAAPVIVAPVVAASVAATAETADDDEPGSRPRVPRIEVALLTAPVGEPGSRPRFVANVVRPPQKTDTSTVRTPFHVPDDGSDPPPPPKMKIAVEMPTLVPTPRTTLVPEEESEPFRVNWGLSAAGVTVLAATTTLNVVTGTDADGIAPTSFVSLVLYVVGAALVTGSLVQL